MRKINPAVRGVVIGLDLGGTWIKGTARFLESSEKPAADKVARWRNPLSPEQKDIDYGAFISRLCRTIALGQPIRWVVASTAGEVDAAGRNYLIAGAHLGVLAAGAWRSQLEKELCCPVTLINDAEAFMLGLAEGSQLTLNRTVGACVIGTGFGFSVVRAGRWWKPDRRLIFLGSALAEEQNYDRWVSAVRAAGEANGDLQALLSSPSHAEKRAVYLSGVARVLASAGMLYHLDEIVLGGGLVDAAVAAKIDLQSTMSEMLREIIPACFRPPHITLAPDGNRVSLHGALALAAGNAEAEAFRYRDGFHALDTEGGGAPNGLEDGSAGEIARHLALAEAQAAQNFLQEAPLLGVVADRMAECLRTGGRIIYVGAGTSGRVGALDAVEIPCTFGEDPERFLAIIAGGVADSALTIESNGEEDVSAVSDLMLVQPGSKDVVVGISASGTAFFVRSALVYSRSKGAYTVLLKENSLQEPPFYDKALALHSGPECVSGSTRLKAGTATKKALNIMSTTAMIRLGKVRRGEMIDLVCTNDKLRHRAENILAKLAGIPHDKAVSLLAEHNYQLRNALAFLELDSNSRQMVKAYQR